MKLPEWRRRRRAIHEAFYDELVGTAGCGAFDGGCLVVAQALQRVIGGEIVVLTRPNGTADHAAVLRDGKLWDYAGPLAPQRFIDRFVRTEMRNMPVVCDGFRPFEDGDLEEAWQDEDLAERLSGIFAEMLPEYGPETDGPSP